MGEIVAQVQAASERSRRECKNRAIIAARQAAYTRQAFSGGNKPLPDIWDYFPFWTEEEIRDAKVEKYRAIMNRWVGGKKGGEA